MSALRNVRRGDLILLATARGNSLYRRRIASSFAPKGCEKGVGGVSGLAGRAGAETGAARPGGRRSTE
jgi:hypothetical protein